MIIVFQPKASAPLHMSSGDTALIFSCCACYTWEHTFISSRKLSVDDWIFTVRNDRKKIGYQQYKRTWTWMRIWWTLQFKEFQVAAFLGCVVIAKFSWVLFCITTWLEVKWSIECFFLGSVDLRSSIRLKGSNTCSFCDLLVMLKKVYYILIAVCNYFSFWQIDGQL